MLFLGASLRGFLCLHSEITLGRLGVRMRCQGLNQCVQGSARPSAIALAPLGIILFSTSGKKSLPTFEGLVRGCVQASKREVRFLALQQKHTLLKY